MTLWNELKTATRWWRYNFNCRRQSVKVIYIIDAEIEANHFTPLYQCEVTAWIPCRFFHSCPLRSKRTQKAKREQTYTERIQATEIDVEWLPKLKGICLHPKHGAAPHHCWLDVLIRLEHGFWDIASRIQSTVKYPLDKQNRSRNHRTTQCESWRYTP